LRHCTTAAAANAEKSAAEQTKAAERAAQEQAKAQEATAKAEKETASKVRNNPIFNHESARNSY